MKEKKQKGNGTDKQVVNGLLPQRKEEGCISHRIITFTYLCRAICNVFLEVQIPNRLFRSKKASTASGIASVVGFWGAGRKAQKEGKKKEEKEVVEVSDLSIHPAPESIILIRLIHTYTHSPSFLPTYDTYIHIHTCTT